MVLHVEGYRFEYDKFCFIVLFFVFSHNFFFSANTNSINCKTK